MITDLQQFNLNRHPLFILFISYCFIETTNPFLGFALQIIPMIKNSHIFIILAWISLPKTLKNISLPKNNMFLALPFLVLILLKTPFVEVSQRNTLTSVAGEWIFYLFYFPLFTKIFCTKAGRECFFICVAISSILGSIFFVLFLGGVKFDFIFISSNSFALLNIFGVPVALRGVLFRSGFDKSLYMISLVLLIFVSLFSGSRANLIITGIQILIFTFYFASFKKIVLSGTLVLFLVLLITSISNPSADVVEFRNKKFNRILNLKEDGSFWLRIALYAKAGDIFMNNILMGAGWGAHSIGKIEGISYEFEALDRLTNTVNTQKKGLHSTYLRIISGTGILGIISALFFFIGNFKHFKKIKFNLIKKLPEYFVFFSIAFGIIINAMQNTIDFHWFLIISSFIVSANLSLENLQMVYLMKLNQHKS